MQHARMEAQSLHGVHRQLAQLYLLLPAGGQTLSLLP